MILSNLHLDTSQRLPSPQSRRVYIALHSSLLKNSFLERVIAFDTFPLSGIIPCFVGSHASRHGDIAESPSTRISSKFFLPDGF